MRAAVPTAPPCRRRVLAVALKPSHAASRTGARPVETGTASRARGPPQHVPTSTGFRAHLRG
jgi:hypothetical protein